MPKADLTTRPKLDRLAAKGIKPAGDDGAPKIDPDGGDHKAGFIAGVAVISRGPALGHGMWVDAETVAQTAGLLNANPKGSKSRFTHPSLSGDGTGKLLGRVKNGVVDGDVARGDLHFTPTSHHTPQGDLGAYVLGLAGDDPEAFGLSIAFQHDIEAENEFVEAHGGRVIDTEWGIYDLSDFKSPDPKNTENTFHVRLKELQAVDVVDDPAANPSGFFHRGQEIPTEADALCAYAFGLSNDRPQGAALGIDPDRLRGFASRFLSTRGLSLAVNPNPKGAGEMPDPKTTLSEGTDAGKTGEGQTEGTKNSEGQTGNGEGTSTGETGTGEGTGEGSEKPPAGETQTAEELAAAKARTELSRFIALDPVAGPQWFSEGKTFSEAQSLAIAKLQADKAELSTKLSTIGRGEAEPVSFSSGEGTEAPKPAQSHLPAGVAKFAASVKLPGRS